MTAGARTVPRKRPRQSRAKFTVDALLAAAAHILVREGYAGTTTNKIAEEAGVSIGSLYQYFPSKEAIIGELVEGFYASSTALLESQLGGAGSQPLEAVTAALVQAMMSDHRRNPALHKVIIEQVPRVGRQAVWLDHQSALIARVVRCLEAYREQLPFTDLEMAAFLLVHAVESIIHSTLAKRPDYLAQPQFADELRRVILGYLTTEVSPGRP